MNRRRPGLCAALLPLVGLLLSCAPARAGVYTGNSAYSRDSQGACIVTGSDNGDFNDKKNWGPPCSPGAVPGPGTTADLNTHNVHGSVVNVGTLTVASGGSLTCDSITTNFLNLGGSILGSAANVATLKVANGFNWIGGILHSLSATLGAKCNTNLSGSADKSLNGGGVLTNLGTINWSGAGIRAAGGGGGTLNNGGVFKMLSDGLVGSTSSGAGISIFNTGTFVKTGGSGTTSIGSATGFINNGGTLQAKAGIFDASSNSQGATQMNGGTIAAGSGVVGQSFQWKFNGTIKVAGTFRLTEASNYGEASFTGPGKIDWKSGGFLNDASLSQMTLAADMHAALSSSAAKNFGVLTNLGTLTWNGGTLAGSLTNRGTFNLLNDGDLGGFDLVNFGTFAKTGGSGKVTVGAHSFSSNGIFDIQKGTLQLANTNLEHDSFLDGSVLKGGGKIVSFAPTAASGTVKIDLTYQMDDSANTGATIVGPATLTGAGSLNWQGGSLDNVTLGGGFTTNASGSAAKSFNHASVNAGTLNWRGGAPIDFGPSSGESLTNSGTFNVLASGAFGQNTLVNQGTLTTFGGKSTFNGVLSNSGVINLGTAAAPGILALSSNDRNGFTTTGTINAFIMSDKVGHYSQLLGSSSDGFTTLTLGGNLTIKTDAKAGLTGASQITLVQTSSGAEYTGRFQTVAGIPTFGAKTFQLYYNALDVTLGLPFSISGHVTRTLTSESGDTTVSVADTRITLTSPTGATQSIMTDASGNYSFGDLPAGTYSVAASKDGVNFDPANQKVVFPNSDGNDAIVNFATYSITVKVVDSDGAPLSGIKVDISGPGISEYQLTTNSDGIVLFPDLGAGSFSLRPEFSSPYTPSPASAQVKLPAKGNSGNSMVTFTRKILVVTPSGMKASANSS